MTRLFAALTLIAALVALASPAEAIERNFAGSAQVDYNFVPTARDANTYPNAFSGFTTELSAKLAVDFSEHLSANLKVCYGCHGFEADMMYFDFRVADELNFRAGRFSPSFGAFNLRHDPANHRLSDKPLPYDMGRMLRMVDWNLGVLPSPFPNTGLEIDGTHWFGQSVSFDYAVYAVTGFKGDAKPTDIDFKLSRQPDNYYISNNGRPTFGGRLELNAKLGETNELNLGASGMSGTYDVNNDLWYTILGSDLTMRFDKTNLRLEYLVRRTDVDTSDPTVFKYAIAPNRGDFFTKHGAYFEVEQALSPELDLIGRVDGLFRVGNVLVSSPLSQHSNVIRYTLGTAYVIERGLRLKFSTELWDFSNPDATTGRNIELSMHLGLAGSF